MTRRHLAAAAVLAVLLVAGLVLLRDPAEPARVASPPVASLAPAARSAEDFAAAACVRLRLAAQSISANSSAERVRAELAAARRLAGEALRLDGSHAPLSGGVAALDEAVRRDDGPRAAEGLRVALAACGQRR